MTIAKSIGQDDPVGPVAVAAFLRRALAELLHVPPDGVRDDSPFREQGLDSVGVVNLAERLSAWLGRAVPAWVPWQHSTVNALSDYVVLGAPGKPSARRHPPEASPDLVFF